MTDDCKTETRMEPAMAAEGSIGSPVSEKSQEKRHGALSAAVFSIAEGRLDQARGLHLAGVGALEASVIGACRFLR